MFRRAPFVAVLLFSSLAWSQDLTQNWTTEKTKHFDDQESGKVTLELLGVNPFYYVYSTAITSKEQSLSDYDKVSAFSPKARAAFGADPCEKKITTVRDEIKSMKSPYDPKTKQISSFTLKETQDEWTDKVKHYDDLVSKKPDCSKADGYAQIVHAHDVLFPANNIPSVIATINAKACRDYTATFSEYFEGSPTGQSVVATFSTTCDQLTVSAGTLLTEIQNPTYASRANPTASGQFLSVENTSRFRPTIAGLLNYNFPSFGDGRWVEPFRVGLSTGPVFQNTQNGGSSFGWFGGASLSLYKRLYLSAGEHFGQFPDLPFGFTPGATIPANFGQLTPRFRYTSRFAFAITFRTNNIGQVFGKTATASSTATGK